MCGRWPDLDGGEVLVELRVQGGQLVDGAVEGAVVVAQDLAQEEGGERHVHHDALEGTRLVVVVHGKTAMLCTLHSQAGGHHAAVPYKGR